MIMREEELEIAIKVVIVSGSSYVSAYLTTKFHFVRHSRSGTEVSVKAA